MKNAPLQVTIEMFSTSTKKSRISILKPEEYFDEQTLVSGQDSVFGMCREWEIYRLFKDFEEFDIFKISIADTNLNWSYFQKITYWSDFRNKLHLCNLFKGDVEQMEERQMILTQSFEGRKYLTNRFIWEGDTWFPEGDATLRNEE